MDRPWFPLYGRDWLDNKELRRCSPAARALLIDLMCLAHEGEPYGYLSDSRGPLTDDYMASRVFVKLAAFKEALKELVSHGRLKAEGGELSIPRMVRDEEIRRKRATGGYASIGHPNTPTPRAQKGGVKGGGEPYPSLANKGHPNGDPSVYPLLRNEGGVRSDACAGMRSDSDSDPPSGSVSAASEKTQNAAVFPGGDAAFDPSYEARMAVAFCLDNHPVSGSGRFAIGWAEREIAASENPREWRLKLCQSHEKWCEFWRREKPKNPRMYIPPLDRWIADGDYLREPPKPLETSSAIAFLDSKAEGK